MYNLYLDEFQWHFPTEEDRDWLEEALAGQTLITASDAIRVAAESDPTAAIVYRSQIVSTQANNERVLWMHHIVNHSARTMSLDAIAAHPAYRGQGITKRVLQEAADWSKINNPFDVDAISSYHNSNEPHFNSNNMLKGHDVKTYLSVEGDVLVMQEIALK